MPCVAVGYIILRGLSFSRRQTPHLYVPKSQLVVEGFPDKSGCLLETNGNTSLCVL
jgi:hypothetical protein